MNGDNGGFAWFSERARILIDAESGPAGEAAAGPAGATATATATASVIDVAKLEGAFKWAAGGFTAVAGLLVFFGIKEGVLDQALRLNAASSLGVFMLLGVGVVAALFAPAIVPTSRMRLWAVVIAVLLMVLVASVLLPDFDTIQRREAALVVDVPEPRGGILRLPAFGLAAVLLSGAGLIGAHLWGTKTPGQGWLTWCRHRWSMVLSVVVLLLLGGGLLAWLLWPIAAQDDPAGVDGQAPGVVTAVMGAAVVATCVVLLTWAFVTRKALPTLAGVVIIAVSATSLGLYGATKLAVQSKMLSVVPQVVGAVRDTDSGSLLTISAKAGRMRGYGLVVRATGLARPVAGSPLARVTSAPRPQELKAVAGVLGYDIVVVVPLRRSVTLWEAVLRPDALDEVERSIEVPIVPERWEAVDVSYCLTRDIADRPTCVAGSSETVAVIRNRASEVGIGQVSGHIGLEGDNLVAVFSASDFAPGVSTQVAVCRYLRGHHMGRLTTATLAPGPDDSVTWREVVPDLPATRWVLRVRSYPPGPPSSQSWTTVASYKP